MNFLVFGACGLLAAGVQPALAQQAPTYRMWVNNERFNIFRPTLLIEGDTISVKVVVSDSLGHRRPEVPVRFSLSDQATVETKTITWKDERVDHVGGMQGLLIKALKPGLVSVYIEAAGLRDTVKLDIRSRLAVSCQGKTSDMNLAVGSVKRWRTEDIDMPSCLRLNKSTGMYLMTVDYTPKPMLFLQTSPSMPGPDRVAYQILTQAAQAKPLRPEPSLTNEPEGSAGGAADSLVSLSRPTIQESLPRSTVAVGDTLRLPGLAGYSWPAGIKRDPRVIVSYVGQNLIMAESVENFEGRLRRPDSTVSMPIPDSLYVRFDSAFGFGKRQLDRVFGQPYKSILRGEPESRPLVVNFAMMPSSWGGAASGFPASDASGYVMLDFWTVTHGRSWSAIYQNPEAIAPKLIAHELAHVRHQETFGMRAQVWFFEGFGAYIEDLALTAATLNRDSLPMLANTPYTQGLRWPNGNAFSPDASILYGYGNSSYFFDYITGLAAAKGGDPFEVVRQMLAADGTEEAYNQIAMKLAGVRIDELIWQSRAALMLDDREPGLPAWTQYRDVLAPAGMSPMMRPWNILPGEAFSSITDMVRGGIQGYVIDARNAVAEQLFFLGLSNQPGMAVTITRLK